MAEFALILFDDAEARTWMPFVLTRPAGELRFGAFTLRERAERVLGAPCAGHLCGGWLEAYDEPWAPPVLDAGALPRDRDLVLLCSRAVLAWGPQPEIPRSRPATLLVQETVCGWYVPAGGELPPTDALLDPGAAGVVGEALHFRGLLLAKPWDMIARNPEQLTLDIETLFKGTAPPALPAGVHVLGEGTLVVEPGASVEPGAVLDLRTGPIWLETGSTVRAFTRLTGPAHIGRGTTLLGDSVSAVSIGPMCRIRGEVEECIILGYTNKAHDGFLGHSYVGAWVNLGALTTTSDLKNNYGPVRVWTPSGEVEAGAIKLGCLLGDHVKTGIGTLLNTGTVVGAGSSIVGPGMPPKYVPPFTWGTATELAEYDLDKFLSVAETVMRRRDVVLTTKQRALLCAAWRLTRGRQ